MSLFSAGDLVENFILFGKSPFLKFGKNQPAINFDFKNAAATLNQFGVDTGLFLDPGRQTGGLGQIISFSAVGN